MKIAHRTYKTHNNTNRVTWIVVLVFVFSALVLGLPVEVTVEPETSQSSFLNKEFNSNPKNGDFVEDSLHQIWYIENKKRRLVESWHALSQFRKNDQNRILRISDEVLQGQTILGENMYIDSDVKRKEAPILSMNQTIPFHPKFSIHYESPFNYGSDSALFFNIWFWKSPKRNVAIFHSSPSTSSALSPVLFAMQGTVMSKHGNGNRKISLFLGIVHSKRSKPTGAGARVSDIELRGIPFANAIDVREWTHVAVTFTRDLLTLYVNGKPGEAFNIKKLNLPKIANGPKYETLPIYREIVFGRFENQDSFTGLLSKGIAYSGWRASHVDVTRHAKANMLEKIPNWISSFIEAYQENRVKLKNDLSIAKIGDSENGLSASGLERNSAEDKDSSSVVDKMNLFYLGRAFASLLDVDDSGNGDQEKNWRISVVKYFFELAEEAKEQQIEKYRKWHATTIEDKLLRSFQTTPCIQKATGWWSYKYCYMKTAQQIHEDKAAHDKSVTNNLGKFVKADSAFFQLDPSDLHLACETERTLGCPHVSFESPRIAVECLNSKLKEDYMQSRCMSLLEKLKNKPAVVLHLHDSGDKCDASTPRRSDIRFECCGDRSDHTLGPIIRNVLEPNSCVYVWEVCVPLLCPPILPIENLVGSVLENSNMVNNMFRGQNALSPERSTRPNIFFESLVITSSSWNNFHIGNNAVDGSKKSEWKSTMQDKLPVITFKLKHPCMSGIKEIKVSWGLSPASFFVYVSEDGNRFVEITSVATHPQMNRVDTLNGWSMSHPSSVSAVRIKITDSGAYTANSIREIEGYCSGTQGLQLKKDSITHGNNGDKVSPRTHDKVEANLIARKETDVADEKELILSQLRSGERKFDIAHTIWMLQYITEAEYHDTASLSADYEANPFKKTLNSLAFNMLTGNQWPSRRFSNTNSQTDFHAGDRHDLYENTNCVDKQSSLLYFANYDTELAAQLYYEAALIVVGPDHKMQHPKPSEELYLSKATKEQLKQFDGEDGDIAVYQKDKAEAGDRNAQMWIAGRYYHGLNGFQLDRQRAANIFRDVADQGDPEAAYNFGVMRLNGQDGNPPDEQVANRYFNIATTASFSPALNGIGVQHMKKGDYANALKYFDMAAREMSADGHFNMGTLCRDGKGVKKNLRKALMHFAIAATLGQPRAMWTLGKAYFFRQSWLSKILLTNFDEGKVFHSYGNDRKKNVAIKVFVKKDQIILNINQRKPHAIKNVTFFMRRNVSVALKYFQTLSLLGTASNISSLALKAWLSQEYDAASFLYEEAASMGRVDAMANIAWIKRLKKNHLASVRTQCTFSSTGNWDERRTAHYYTSSAAMQGSVDDLLVLGSTYEQDKLTRGLVSNIYEFASSHGSQEAMFRLALNDINASRLSGAAKNLDKCIESSGVGSIPCWILRNVLKLYEYFSF